MVKDTINRHLLPCEFAGVILGETYTRLRRKEKVSTFTEFGKGVKKVRRICDDFLPFVSFRLWGHHGVLC